MEHVNLSMGIVMTSATCVQQVDLKKIGMPTLDTPALGENVRKNVPKKFTFPQSS